MWNRVALLLAGVAAGWNLVNYWTVAQEQARTQAVRVIVATGVGLALVGGLGATRLEAAGVGAVVFALSALVAYMANARQVSSVDDAPLGARPQAPEREREGVAALLVLPGEPAVYDGPGFWARAFRAVQARGGRVPHWFLRPPAYARIRTACAAVDCTQTLAARLQRDGAALAARLDRDDAVQFAYLYCEPLLLPTLAKLAEDGWRRLVIVPLGHDTDPSERLHERVARSRVREQGMAVAYAEPLPRELWDPAPWAERLPVFSAGRPPPLPAAASDRALHELAERIRACAPTPLPPSRGAP